MEPIHRGGLWGMGRCACQGVGAGTVLALHGVCRRVWHGVCAGVQGRRLAGVTGRGDWAGSALSPGQAALPPRETPPLHASISTRRAIPTGIHHAPPQAPCQPRYTSPLDMRTGPCNTGPHDKEKVILRVVHAWKTKGRDLIIKRGIHHAADSNPICVAHWPEHLNSSMLLRMWEIIPDNREGCLQ